MQMDDDGCEHCSMDRVELREVPACFVKSIVGVVCDLVSRKDDRSITAILTENDRLLYIVAAVVILLSLRLFFR